MSSYYNPVKTLCGIATLQQLGNAIDELDGKVERVLLMTRGGDFRGSAEEQQVIEQLQGRTLFQYEFMRSNPDVTDLMEVINDTKDMQVDLIVALGGGSVLDVGKSLCAFQGMEIETIEQLRESIVTQSYITNKSKSRWVGIPTTSGTGSEVTCWATIWDKANIQKYSIDSKDNYAAIAIVDPLLTLKLPLRLTVSSALDAVCHATESYWSKRTNLITRQYAITAIDLIISHIEKLIEDPDNPELREKIAQGSMLAGLAFSNTATTACHAISYPLTLMFGIDHGVAVSVTLAQLLEINEDHIIEKERLFASFGVQNAKEVGDLLERIFNKSAIPYRLGEYGLKRDDLPRVSASANNGRINNNPVVMTEEIILGVLQKAY